MLPPLLSGITSTGQAQRKESNGRWLILERIPAPNSLEKLIRERVIKCVGVDIRDDEMALNIDDAVLKKTTSVIVVSVAIGR